MAGRFGTAPPGAGSPVRGQAGAGAVDVVARGVTLAAALWAGEEEQALNSNAVIPTTASAPQARRCRTPKRSIFAIAGRDRTGTGPKSGVMPSAAQPLALGIRQAEGVPAAVPALAAPPVYTSDQLPLDEPYDVAGPRP